MPYLPTERVKEIRKEIKSTFPEFKFSVTTRHHSTVNVKILSGPIDFGTENRQINHFHIESNWEDRPEAQQFLLKLHEIMDRGNYIASVDGDYGNIPSFYTSLEIGKWDRPYQQITN